MSLERCAGCGCALSRDEMAVTQKLINRGTRVFYCKACLAKHFEVRPEDIQERIDYFKASGCTLFTAEPDPETVK